MAELVYLYGLIPAKEEEEKAFEAFTGLDGRHEAYTVSINNVTAVVCNLNEQEYSEESIKNKINNDTEWLQEKAFHHHETLLALDNQYTVIPMKFCTIYANERSLKETIEKNEAKLTNSFGFLDGKEEWNLKIYCDEKQLREHVLQHNSIIEAKKEEISQLPPGRQYFEKKKINQLLDRELENEINKVCEGIHEKLKMHSQHDMVKNNWSKDVTGKADNMSWNSVYLVPGTKVENFLEKIKQTDAKMEGLGWRFEATGPWPAYHFASLA